MARVVLTYPLPRIGPLAGRLRALGHAVLELPVRRLVPLIDLAAASDLHEKMRSLDWVVFTSPGTVDAVWSALPCPWPDHVGIATVGAGTEHALLARGLDPQRLREPLVRPHQAPYDAAALMREKPFDRPQALRMMVLRGETGRDDWIEDLQRQGAQVRCLAVHRSESVALAQGDLDQARLWLDRSPAEPVFFVFSSLDAITVLSAQLPMAGRDAARALAIHPKLVNALRKCGWTQASLLEPGEPGLLLGLQ